MSWFDSRFRCLRLTAPQGIDVCDVSYGKMAEKSRLVRNVLRLAFPSCIDGSTKGIKSSGQTVWNVTSIDIILFEED